MSLKEQKAYALSDKDVLKLVKGKAKVLVYSQLKDFATLDDALGKHGAIFLLYETEPDFGHWCALFRQTPTIVEFFDPYGKFPDTELKWVPQHFKKLLGADYPTLTQLMYESPYNIEYSPYKFQKMEDGVATCGRWSALRIFFRELGIDDFWEIFGNNKDIDLDSLVTVLTTPDL